VFGLIAGVAAMFIGQERERGDRAGIRDIAILGNTGAILSGYLSSGLFGWGVKSFSIAGLAVAVAGALLLLFLYHLTIRFRRTA
jgi:uncharacterized membrane protein YeaQ/YmgE (transglycosylase-associated protein family)